ncbi:MAG TPA: prolipoprotein diacylglyceryl transferase [Streptosporangiaceae bacterium]|jgi:prolipoprotein diacylglyceryl transferase
MEPTLAFIPSPHEGVWHLGPIPIRAYALCIIAGVIIAVWMGERRWKARGGEPGALLDIATWAVPFGLVGGRLYHVLTDGWQLYFAPGRDPIQALEIWKGGLGIWGAIALGALGAWIGCRRKGVSIAAFADTVAPGIAIAQAVGRWGNWFNQELFGKPSTLPWALKIDPGMPSTIPGVTTYQPTFLYESLWCIGVAILVLWATKRFRLTHGRAFALYVAAYTVGRAWIEYLRIDEAHHFLGLRINDWTALIVFLAAIAYMYLRRNDTSPESIRGNQPSTAGDGTDADAKDADPETDAKDADAETDSEADADPEGGSEGDAEESEKADAESGDTEKAATETKSS